MRLSKSAHYALQAALEMALTSEPVTVAQVAQRHHLPEGALAKVFQALVRGGIAQGTRGVGGGYRLLRPAAQISVLQVIEVFEPPRGLQASPATGAGEGRLQELFAEVDELTRSTFASVSLETLTR
jgi:Rrf2 family transcriptional regulator, nitric oxide-sensitive transcriptional repressor